MQPPTIFVCSLRGFEVRFPGRMYVCTFILFDDVMLPMVRTPISTSVHHQALMVGNSSIRMLDLSHNMIGDKETYNFVRPDFTTGGEAIAEMLEVFMYDTPSFPRTRVEAPGLTISHAAMSGNSQTLHSMYCL